MNLSKNAMLVSVTIVNGGLLGERKDTKASAFIEKKFATAPRRAKASKYLIDHRHASVKAVIAASQNVRYVMQQYTMPWGDDKSRLLPKIMHEEFSSDMEKAVAKLEKAWGSYLSVYPSLVAQSERDLGDLFDRSQYPSASACRDLFRINVTYWPIPEAGHFVVDLTNKAVVQARKSIEAEIDERLNGAASDIILRARETVAVYVDKLAKYRPNHKDGVQGAFRDSLVANCRVTADLVDKLNVTENKALHEIANQMRRLATVSADQLRDDFHARTAQKKKGQELLAVLENLDIRDAEVAKMEDDVSHLFEGA